MAGYRQPLTGSAVAGFAAALALLAGAAAIFFLLFAAGGMAGFAVDDLAYVGRVFVFTLMQAALSTLLSLGAAVPLARALARQAEFPGRDFFLKLAALPLVMPTIVGIFGLVAVYGSNGWLARIASGIGIDWQPHIYGLGGILLGHVFFNLPLGLRLLLPAYAAVPAETWRLAAQLGMRGGDIWRVIEAPLMRQQAPGVAIIIFALCFSSFAIVLTLGGGPAATTLEVAIYQALRFDFDLAAGAILALLQLGACALFALALWRWARAVDIGTGLRLRARRFDGAHWLARIHDFGWIGAGFLFLALPLAALFARGISGLDAAAPVPVLMAAALIGVALGLSGGIVATFLAFLLAGARQRISGRGWRGLGAAIALSGRIGLAVSPMVLGTGLYLWATGRFDLYRLAPIGIVLVNSILALPFALGILEPAVERVARRHDRLCTALGIAGWQRLRIVDWPVLRPAIGQALGLSSVVAMGDLGAIALFGSHKLTNLTLLLYNQLAAYRLDGAAATALLLLMLALGLYWSIERGVGGIALR